MALNQEENENRRLSLMFLPFLLKMIDAHINGEFCNSIKSISMYANT